MNHINRLLMQAKKAKNGNGIHVLGFVDYDVEKGCFTTSASIWNGVPGMDKEFHSEHETAEQAIAACETIAARYPGCENINFIVDDLSFPEVGEYAQG